MCGRFGHQMNRQRPLCSPRRSGRGRQADAATHRHSVAGLGRDQRRDMDRLLVHRARLCGRSAGRFRCSDGRTTHQVIGKLGGSGRAQPDALRAHRYQRLERAPLPRGAMEARAVLGRNRGRHAVRPWRHQHEGRRCGNHAGRRRGRRSGRARKGDLFVACVAAETGGGVGAVHLINSGLRPDYCIVTEASNLDVGVISGGYVQGKISLTGEFKARVPYVNPIEKAAKLVAPFGPSYHPLKTISGGRLASLRPSSLNPRLSADGGARDRAFPGCNDHQFRSAHRAGHDGSRACART